MSDVIRTDAAEVVYFGTTLINLETDTVSSTDDIKDGKIGHLRDGSVVRGTNKNDVDSTDITAGKAAATGDIVSGQEAYVNGEKIVGSMPVRGDVAGYISTKDGKYTIPAGLHSGGGSVEISAEEKANIVPENIAEGHSILGVQGSHQGATPVQTEVGSATPSNSQQTITPSAGHYFSSVVVAAIPYSETIGSTGGKIITIG